MSGTDPVAHMLIIAGHLEVEPGERDAYVAECAPIVEAARASIGCLEFSITSDSLDPAQIRIYKRWESAEQLLAFHGAGPSSDQRARILEADVKRYPISSVGAP